MMNPEIKKLWVEALRSGEYRQARGKLRTRQNGFCCLGVLCNIHAQQNPQLVTDQPSDKYFGYNAALPYQVKDWAGLDSADPDVKYRNYFYPLKLSDLNDSKRLNFNQIADIIEEQL